MSGDAPGVIRGKTRLGESIMTLQIRLFWTDESGQDLVEYSLLLGLLVLVVILALRIL